MKELASTSTKDTANGGYTPLTIPVDGEQQLLSRTGKAPVKRFICPFRKRNPTRFNVRDFHSCANHGFDDISKVKRHVMSEHRRHDMSKHGETVKFVLCHGCKTTLKDHAVLERHQEDGLCHEFSKSPTEDDGFELGITDDVAAKLRGRGAVSRVMDWESLWLTLFPNDTYIPPPNFQPILELEEASTDLTRMILMLENEVAQNVYLIFSLHQEATKDQLLNRLRATGFMMNHPTFDLDQFYNSWRKERSKLLELQA